MSSTADRRRRPTQAAQLESLEDRLLLTTMFGGDTFEFIDATGQTIRVALRGDIIAEFIAADVDQSSPDPFHQLLVVGDIPGHFESTIIGQSPDILGGRGGADGLTVIGPTSISDGLYFPGNLNLAVDGVPDLINLSALASQDAIGNGGTYAFNVTTVEVTLSNGDTEDRQIIQLVRLTTSGASAADADVQSMLQQASLYEDVMSNLSQALPQINAFAIDPITGLGYAVGDVGFVSMLYRINRATGLVTTIGPLTNVSHLGNPSGGQLSDVQALTFNSLGQLFLLTQDYDANPGVDANGGGLATDTALVAVDKTTGQFTDAEAMSLRTGGIGEAPGRFLGMAFLPGNDGTLYAVNALGALVQITVPAAPFPRFIPQTGIADVTDGSSDDPLDIRSLAFARDIADRVVLVGLEYTDDGPRLDYIDVNNGVAVPECLAGTIRSVNDIASYTQPGDARPLLFAVDSFAGQLIRGSAVTMPVDEDGVSDVASILAADFRPRTGSPDDGLLFFVGRQAEGEIDRLYSIDTTKLNRSAIQNTMTLQGTLWADPDDERTITSIAWDQTGASTATLTAVQTGGDLDTGAALWDVNIFGGGLAGLGNFRDISLVIGGDPEDVTGISGIEFVNDDPLTTERYVYAVLNDGGGSQLLRIDGVLGTSFILGPLPDPQDTEDEIVGSDLQGLAWNPLVYNPFTGEFGALIATDASTDELVILDFRPRFATADLFAIFVSQAGEDASIAIAVVPDFDPDDPTAIRTMEPFGGAAGSLRVQPAQGGEMIVIGAGGNGGVWIGARSEDVAPDPIDDEDLRPMYRWNVAQIGVRPAGYDDVPDDTFHNLSAGLTVAQSLLALIDDQPGLAQHMMGQNVGRAHSMAVDRNGNIYLVDADGLDQFGTPINQDQIIQLDPLTGMAKAAIGLLSGGNPVHGVLAMAYGDADMDGQAELYAIINTPSYVPTQLLRQPLPGDVFHESATALTVTPGGIMYAVAANVNGNYDLYRINRPATGALTVTAPLEIFEVLPDGTTSPVRAVTTLEASPISGTLYIIGRDNQGQQALYTLNPNPTDLVPGDGDMEAQAFKVGKLRVSGQPVTDPFTGLAFLRVDDNTEVLFASQERATGSFLFQVDEDTGGMVEQSGGTLGTGRILVAGAGASVVVRGMDFDPDGNLIAVDRGTDAGTGRLIKVNLQDPGMSEALAPANSLSALYVGYASDAAGLFYTIDPAGVDLDDRILVTPGYLPTLGTITLTSNQGTLTGASFTPIALLGGGSVSTVTTMAFSPHEGSIPGRQGLYVIADGLLYEVNPVTGALISAGDSIVSYANGTSFGLTISSMSFDEVGTLYGQDPHYGRLVDIDLASLGAGTVWAGLRMATSVGSLRPTVGAIAYDFEHDRFLAVDNATANNTNGGTGSATLFRMLGTWSDSAVGQNMYRVMIGGTVTGHVSSSGSMDVFYAGWLVTGSAIGLLEPELNTLPANIFLQAPADTWTHQPDNFFFAGDLRNLIVSGAIGTNNDGGLDEPVYLSGFDMHIMGKLGQLKTLADFIGAMDVENQNGILNLPDSAFADPLGYLPGDPPIPILYHHEIEYRDITGIPDDVAPEGWLFERFELYNGSYTNDSFDTAQYVGSVRSGILGQPDVIRVVGSITASGDDVAGSPDNVDYYAVALMAGQTVTVQLQTTFFQIDGVMIVGSALVGVFDPDGRLIATNLGQYLTSDPFRFTADRPGAYRFAIGGIEVGEGTSDDILFTNAVDMLETPIPYQLLITGAGDLAVGGFVVGTNMFAPAYLDSTNEDDVAAKVSDPTAQSAVFRIRRGDMGAFVAGDHFFGESLRTLQVDTGNLRSLVAANTGKNSGTPEDPQEDGLYVDVSGSLGMYRTTGGSGWLYAPSLIVGNDVQLLDAANVLRIYLSADGGLGILRAGSMGTTVASTITVNADNIGSDGIIDLIEVTGDLGLGGVGGPHITTGPGGNVRYMRVGGTVFRDTYFGAPPPDGDSYTFIPTPEEPTRIVRDDSGAEIWLVPLPDQIDEFGNPAIDPVTHLPVTATLTYRAYGIRGSGGSVLINVDSTGGLRVGSNTFGNLSPAEIGTINVAGAGRAVVNTPGLPDPITLAPTVGTLALEPDAGTNLIVEVRGGSPIDVYEIVGGNFTRITNITGGEIVNVTADSIGELYSGWLGVAVNHTGADVQGIAVVSDVRPFRLQKNGIVVTGDVVSATARRGVGNLIIGGGIGSVVANAGGTVDHADGEFRGIVGPIRAVGDINFVQIGEGMGPSGSGEFSRAGIYAEGTVWRVVNQGAGSDIRGTINGQTGIENITLHNGSLIDTLVTTILIDDTLVWGGLTVVGGPMGNINITGDAAGRGGIIGTTIRGSTLGNTTITGGFGILNSSFSFATSVGTLGNVTTDGYGIRSVTFIGGITMGNLTANGTGNLLSVLDYSPSVRYSQDGDWDPFNQRLSPENDLHRFLGTTLIDPIITGISESGMIEDVTAEVNKSIGVVRAFRMQGKQIPGMPISFPGTLPANTFHASDYIGGFIILEDIRDGLEITTGRLGIFRPGGDVYGLDMSIAGRIDRIDIRGSLLADSVIFAHGANGDINYVHIAGNMDGDIHASGKVGTILIDGNLTGNIIIDGTNRTSNVLSLLRLGGSLTRGSLDIKGDVGTIDVAGSLGAMGDRLVIDGDLAAIRVGTNPTINGSALALDLAVTGNLGSLAVTGRSTGNIFVGGDATSMSVQSDPATVGHTLMSGNVDILGTLRGLTVRGGDLNAMVTAGKDITTATVTDGSLGEDASLTSAYGNVGTVSIRNGDLLGDVRAPDGTIRSLTVTGSDLGTQGTIQAAALGTFRLDGSVLSGATIDITGAVTSFQIGRDVEHGASIRLGKVPSVLIGGDALGQMILGFNPTGTILTIGGDLGGSVEIDGKATITARGDMKDDSRLVVTGNVPSFTVTGTVSGTAVVDGSGGTFHFGSLSGAVITTGFDLLRLNLDGDASNSAVQVGISRGTPLPGNQPVESPLPPPAPDDGILEATVFALNPYKAKLDGQWYGSLAASDGKVYFGSSTHADDASGMLFQYNPATEALNVVADSLSEISGESEGSGVPQGKLHSPIVESNGWIYFDTHLGNYWDEAVAAYTGSHLIGYELGSLERGSPVFRDYGVMIPYFTGYAGVAVDPAGENVWAVVTPWRPEDYNVSGGHLVRTNINSGEMTDFGSIDPNTQGQESSFFLFADERGDCWASINNGTDKLYVARGATGTMESYDHALPAMTHTTQKGVASPYQTRTFWNWGQALDGNRALFTEVDGSAQDANLYVSGSLYEFDSSKTLDGDASDAFREVAWIGGNGLDIVYEDGIVYYARRSDVRHQAKIDGSPDNGETFDPALDTGVRLHLYSVDLSQADPDIVDYGAIMDSEGRFPWRLEGMSAQDGKVFLSGDWIWTGDVPDDYHSYRRRTDGPSDPGNPYVPFIRGQSFVVIDLTSQGDDGDGQIAEPDDLFGTGSMDETGRIATLGGFTLGGKMTNTIIAAGGSITQATVPGGMTNSSISSGFVLGGSGIQAVIDDGTPLANLAELDAARGADDRTLLWGNFGAVTVGRPWQVQSALTAGVDPGNDGAFGVGEDADADNVDSSLSGGTSKFTGAVNTWLDRDSYLLADAGTKGTLVAYTLADLTTNNPLEALQTTVNGRTVHINVGGHTVTIQISGPGELDVHDDNPGDTLLDTLVIRGGTSQTSVQITTDLPGSVSIARVLTQDDSTIGSFRFDGDLVGDGTADVDLWIDGPVSTLNVRDLGGNGWTGKIGGDLTTFSLRNQNAAQLYIGGKVGTFNVVASSANPLMRDLAAAPSDDINTVATDSAGNLWVFDTQTGKLSKVNRLTGQTIAQATVTDAFGGGALTLTGIDFTGGDVLLAVATLFDMSPTRRIGPVAAAPADLRGMAVARDGRVMSIEEATYLPIGELGGNYNILAMAAGNSQVLAINDIGPNLTLFRITFDSLGQVTGFTSVGSILLEVDQSRVTNVHAMTYDSFLNRFLAIGNVPSQYGDQQLLLSISAASGEATIVSTLTDAGGSVNFVEADPDNLAVIPDSIKGLAASRTGGAVYVVRSIGGVDRLFSLDTAGGVLTEVIGTGLAGNGEILVNGAAVNLVGLASDASGYFLAVDSLTGRTIRVRTNDPAGSWALDENGSAPAGTGALAIDAAGALYTVDTTVDGRPMYSNIGRDRLVSFDLTSGIRQTVGVLSYSGNGYFNDVLSIGFDDMGKLFALVRDTDGVGGTATFGGKPNGVSLAAIETVDSNADGFVRVSGPTTTGSAVVLLDNGGVANDFTAMAIDRNGKIWAVRRTLDGLHDELVSISLIGVATLEGTVLVDGADTGIVGMGFAEGGQLVAYSTAGAGADLIHIDTIDPTISQRISAAAGTLNPAVEAFAIGRTGTHFASYAFDNDGFGGDLYTCAGQTSTLGQVDTATGVFTRFQGLAQDDAGTVLTSPIVDFAIDPSLPGHVYAVTADSRLMEFDTGGALVRLAGTVTDMHTGLVLAITQIEFDADGRLIGVDGDLDRLVHIGTATAEAAELTESAAVDGGDIVALTYDVDADAMVGFRTSDDTFVAFRGVDSDGMAGVTATAITQLNIGAAGSAGYGGRIVTTGNSFETIKVTGDFSGSLVTAGPVQRYMQTGGDFAGSLHAGGNITLVSITGGDFAAGASVVTPRELTTFTLTGGDFAGLIFAGSVGTITVNGSGLDTADLLVDGAVRSVAFGGRFDGSMALGSAGTISVTRELGAQSVIDIQGNLGTLRLGGTTAGSVIAVDGTATSITIGMVTSGTVAVRRSVGSIRLADATDGIVTVGMGLGSLTVTGAATGTLFSSGVWIGDDHLYNTADDVIVGGSIGVATFTKAFTDSVVVAGVLPDPSVGPGMPDDRRVFIGNPTSADVVQVDSAQAGGVLVSNLGTLNFLGDVVSTQSNIGHMPVAAAAGSIGRIIQRLRGSTIAHRSYGDPFGAPTVLSATLANDTEVRVTFSEEINSGSLSLSRDVDGDGSLDGPADIIGSILVNDADGRILNDISLSYSTTMINGRTVGVVTIRKATAFSNGVFVTLSGSLTEPAIVDRSGLRSALRDLNRDGVASVNEDAPGTILDGGGEGIEGGDFIFIGSDSDISSDFQNAIWFWRAANAGNVEIEGAFWPLDVSLTGSILTDPFFRSGMGDVDVYSFPAEAFQFVSLELQTDAIASMGLFFLDDQGTADPSDDLYELVARVGSNRITNPITGTDRPTTLKKVFELPRTGMYYIVLFGQEETITSFDWLSGLPSLPAPLPYTLKVVLAGSDDMLDGSPNGFYDTTADDPIAYVSNAVGENHNELGANTPKQLVYLDFDGGTATAYWSLVNQDVPFQAMDLSVMDAALVGLEASAIEGDVGDGVTGIVDNIMAIYRNVPLSSPNGVLNVQRITTLSQWMAADEGLFFTTVDPQTWGLNPRTDFTTVFIGESDNAVMGEGFTGLASNVDVAGQSRADNAAVFVQGLSGVLTGITLSEKLNQASTLLANLAAHELGHTLGLNHQSTDGMFYDLSYDDPDNNPATGNDSNTGAAAMAYAPDMVTMTQLMQFGTANLSAAEFPIGSIDTADLLTWWFS